MAKKILRIYTGTDGKSHFEDVEIAMENAIEDRQYSAHMKAKEVYFLETSADYDLAWHNAPCRQFTVLLDGGFELETGDGTKRRLGPGEILLAEDTTGQGHIARSVNNQPRKALVVRLA